MKPRLPLFLLSLAFASSFALPACGDLTDVPAYVYGTFYRPDGQLVVATTAGIKIYDGDFTTEAGSIRVDVEAGDLSAGAHLSGDGKVAALSEEDRHLLYSIPDGASLGTFQPSPFEPFVALSPAGDKAYGYGYYDPMNDSLWPASLYNLADGSPLWSVEQMQQAKPRTYCWTASQNGPPPVFTPDGASMYMAFGEHLVIADVATGAMRPFAEVKACIGSMTLLPDGSLLVLNGLSGTPGYPGLNGAPVTGVNGAALPNSFGIYAQDGTLARELPPFPNFYSDATMLGSASQVACSPEGDRCAILGEIADFHTNPGGLATLGGPSYLMVFSLDGTLLQSIPPGGAQLSFSPDGSRIAVAFHGAPSSKALIYRVADGTLLAERSYTAGVF